MAALAKGRATLQYGTDSVPSLFTMDVAASTTCYQGGIACRKADGYATPGATATTLVAMGVFAETVDNSAGSAADKDVDIRAGAFWFANSSAGDAIAITEIGTDCYIVDDQTVAKTNGSSTRSRAGKVLGIDATKGVLVLIHPAL